MQLSDDPGVMIYEDEYLLSIAAAGLFTRIAALSIQERKRFLVALSGGSTPQRLFKILSQPPHALNVPWEQSHFFWCDERLVPPGNPESNFGQAFEMLFSQIKVPEENLHRMRGEEVPAQAVEEYRRMLESFGEEDRKWPRFDLVFLGLGADGHTASLFPGVIDPKEKSSTVMAVTTEYQGRPAGRITLTPLVFNGARNVVFMVSGKDKTHAVHETLNGQPNLDNWPAQRIHPVDGNLVWLLDAAAAGR